MDTVLIPEYNNDETYNQDTIYNTLIYTDTSLTNEKLGNIIELYKPNIFVFVFNENKRIFIGYKASPKLEDISLVTIGETEFIKINKTKRYNQKEIKFFNLYRTDTLQSIGMMDDAFTKYGPDPLLFI